MPVGSKSSPVLYVVLFGAVVTVIRDRRLSLRLSVNVRVSLYVPAVLGVPVSLKSKVAVFPVLTAAEFAERTMSPEANTLEAEDTV